jgi:hypothetical protein
MAADRRKYSSRDIGDAMEREFGVSYSRNSIIGKCKRMDIALQCGNIGRRAANGKRRGGPQKLTRASWGIGGHGKPKPPTPLSVVTAGDMANAPLHIGIFDLRPHHCRWPYGERAPYTSCGHDKIGGSSYCGIHTQMSQTRSAR